MIIQFIRYLVTVVLLAGISFNASAIAEDPYEVNNTLFTATDLSLYQAVPLSTIAGQGASWDEDWYMIYVNSGSNRVQVDLQFLNTDADLDLELYDSSGVLLIESTSATDNEYIEYDVAPTGGTYYIRVITYTLAGGLYNGAAYDLQWNTVTPVDDLYEENDSFASAFDHTGNEGFWLSDLTGSGGIAADVDYYMITVTSGYERVQVELLHSQAEGDLGIELYDAAFASVVYSNSDTDNESIDFEVPVAGTYYIAVYNNSGYTGQAYDLWWDDLVPTTVVTDDAYEENDDISTAYSQSVNTWLSAISGMAVAADQDWYQIQVSSGLTRVQVDLQFTHAEGDLDIALKDSAGSTITESIGVVDNESIDYDVVSAGTYYLVVTNSSGVYTSQSYDLLWNGVQPTTTVSDDLAEPNNDSASAFVFSSTSTWLSDLTGGFVTSNDEDWYQITVPADKTQLYVYLEYIYSQGDIDITLYNSLQQIVGTGNTTGTNDNDEMSFRVSSGGTYYIRVYNSGSYSGQNYNMWWGVTTPSTTIANDDAYEVNNNAASAYPLSLNNTSLGQGISNDEDWYQIVVPADKKHIIADLLFTHGVNSDLDLYLIDSDGTTILAGSFTADSNENIEFTVPASGAYYLQVVTWTGDGDSYAGATYELRYSVVDPNNATGNTTTTTNTKGGILTGGGGSSGGGGGGSLGLTGLLLILLPALLRRRIYS